MSDTDDKQTLNDAPIDAPAPRRRRSDPRQDNRIDLREALRAPVRLKRDGGVKSIDPYEAMLRQHVRKSLVERCVASIKLVLGEAEKHEIIKQPPPPVTGGVFTVPKNLPEEIERQIFDPDYRGRMSLIQIMALLLTVIDVERLKRCFNGRD